VISGESVISRLTTDCPTEMSFRITPFFARNAPECVSGDVLFRDHEILLVGTVWPRSVEKLRS